MKNQEKELLAVIQNNTNTSNAFNNGNKPIWQT